MMRSWTQVRIRRLLLRTLALVAVALVCGTMSAPFAFAQSKTGQDEYSKRVTQRRDSAGNELPTRVTETRSEDGSRKVQVIEAAGPDGRYQPLLEREEETVQVDAQTTRVVVKEYGRNADGSRSLLRQTEAETSTLPGGAERTTRNISRPDVNGRMQQVERALEESTQTDANTRETKRTVLQPDVNGALVPVDRVLQVEQRQEGGVTEVITRGSRPDANGRWGAYEVRQKTVQQTEDGGEVVDERVFGRDLNDRESLKERNVARKWKDADGQEHQVAETYSRANSGANVADSSRLPLAQRSMGVTMTQADGSQRTVQSVERRTSGNSSDGVRAAEQSVEISRPDSGGRQSQRTVKFEDANRGLRDTVVVDFAEQK